jgi:hypothetical protein
MERREALKYVGLITGGTLISTQLFLSGCKQNIESKNTTQADFLTADQIALLNDIGEIIIPATDTPGAKAANVGLVMAINIRDCYDKEKQESFLKGLVLLDDRSKSLFKDSFSKISPENQVFLITELDKEVYSTSNNNKDTDDLKIFYKMVKELTLLGYFTSEVCLTSQLEYIPVPAKYDGAMAHDGKSNIMVFGNGL